MRRATVAACMRYLISSASPTQADSSVEDKGSTSSVCASAKHASRPRKH